jgi:hypothetical protein
VEQKDKKNPWRGVGIEIGCGQSCTPASDTLGSSSHFSFRALVSLSVKWDNSDFLPSRLFQGLNEITYLI